MAQLIQHQSGVLPLIPPPPFETKPLDLGSDASSKPVGWVRTNEMRLEVSSILVRSGEPFDTVLGLGAVLDAYDQRLAVGSSEVVAFSLQSRLASGLPHFLCARRGSLYEGEGREGMKNINVTGGHLL